MQKQTNQISCASQTAKDAYEELQNDPNTTRDEAWGTLDDGVDISGTLYNENRAENIETGQNELEREFSRNGINLPEEEMEKFILVLAKKQHLGGEILVKVY